MVPKLSDKARRTLGLILKQHEGYYKEIKASIETFKEAIRIKPDDAEAHFNLGTAYGQLEDKQKAILPLQQAIHLKPDYAEAHYGLGVVYANLKDYQKAIVSLQQAIRLKPDYAEAHYILGLNYTALGDRSSALKEYEILKDSDKEQAQELLDDIPKE